MAIPISTNFDVMTSIPIDSRLVKSDITSRNAISNTWRYIGLTVYVVSDQCDYRLIGGISDSNWQKVTASFAISASWAPSGGGVTPGGSYNISASWASQSLSASWAPSGEGVTPGGSYDISASWTSQSFSSSYANISSTSISSSIANTASYIQGGNVVGTVISASYAKNAQLIIDMDWHLVRNSNTSLQTTHNFVPGTTLLARNGILCTMDYVTTEYDYFESGSNQIQLHFTMSGDTKMMVVYSML